MNHIKDAFEVLSRAELDRNLDQLADEQIDTLTDVCEQRFSARGTAVNFYREAVRRGWLMGPA